MNPSAKAAGLSFQLSSSPEEYGPSNEGRRSDVRLHDVSPATDSCGSSVGIEVRPYSGCECFIRRRTTRWNLARHSVSKVHSRPSRGAKGAFTDRGLNSITGRFSMANIHGGPVSSAVLKQRASSEQLP